jgi:ABC-type multidrug transport system fused ATPase/permease subunit
VAFYGWAAEEIADMLKIKAFRNVLRQGASYFDNPQNANAKIVKHINSDGVSIKAALDNRLYHFVNNVFSSVLELALAFFYSVQVSVAGTILYSILCAILWYLAGKLRTAIHMLHLADDSAKVSDFYVP